MMEKVFESLKFIFDEALFSEYKNETHNKVRECHSIVYEALKELKAIKEVKSSGEYQVKVKYLELLDYGEEKQVYHNYNFNSFEEAKDFSIKEKERLVNIPSSSHYKIVDIEVSDPIKQYNKTDNTNPSEAFECLERIREFLQNRTNTVSFQDLRDVEQALLKAQEQEEDIIHYRGTIENLRRDIVLLKEIKKEQEKVLEIIWKKNVDVQYVRYEAVNVKMYNDYISQLNKVSTINHSSLEDEEFDLLKRWKNV